MLVAILNVKNTNKAAEIISAASPDSKYTWQQKGAPEAEWMSTDLSDRCQCKGVVSTRSQTDWLVSDLIG